MQLFRSGSFLSVCLSVCKVNWLLTNVSSSTVVVVVFENLWTLGMIRDSIVVD